MILSAQRRHELTQKANGYAANVAHAEQYLLGRGISRQVAEMFQLGYVDSGPYSGRLSIPYVTPAGVVAIKYRCAESHDCKAVDCVRYLNESNLGTHLWNASVLIGAETAVICEGELDAVCVQAYCGLPAVGYPGVDTWSNQRHWRLCFEGLTEVIVIADGEKTGHAAARKVAESIGMSARIVDMPSELKDANLYIKEKGANAFMEYVNR